MTTLHDNLVDLRRILKQFEEVLDDEDRLEEVRRRLEDSFNILIRLGQKILEEHPEILVITEKVELFLEGVREDRDQPDVTLRQVVVNNLHLLDIPNSLDILETEITNTANTPSHGGGTRRRRRRKRRTTKHKSKRKNSRRKRGRKHKTRRRKHKTRRRK